LTVEPVAGRFWLGQAGGEMADEVVIAVKRTEPVPWLEMHAHGGQEVVHFLSDLLREQDLQPCTWEEFLRQTDADALRVAATIALTQAVTVRTAGILLDQQQGALAKAFDAITQTLEQSDNAKAAEQLRHLLRYAAVGQRLTQPWRVVVAGAPNVGKSSLVNALAGYPRSIVAETPGTTRDVVTTRIALDGWLIELADTAGQRTEAEALEELGIRQAQATAVRADLCLWVVEAAAPPVWPSQPLERVQFVVNKCDLATNWNKKTAPDAVWVSARTGAGLAALSARVIARLVSDPPPAGAAVPFAARLCAGTEEALRNLSVGNGAEARRVVLSLREHP
jgi:tRNA modification GTPase